jgi:tetratricopeptide (TPR) repeat protein
MPDTPKAAKPPSVPPSWRDAWAWASLLAVVPLVVRSLGAPLGVPVADDWDFVHRALLTGERSLLDGGGSSAFWRPIPHQIYYQLCSSLMLARPLAIAALHTGLLSLMVLLAYRAARTRLPAPAAAVVGSFPLLAESTRAIVAWPSHMVELSFLFFSVLALHEAAFRRLPTSVLALIAALLSKEVAVVTAALLPWVPAPAPGAEAAGPSSARRERLRWIACSAAVTLAWGLAYLAVRNAQGLHLPHDLESAPGTVGTPWLARYAWALVNSLRASLSLPMERTPWEPAAWGGLLVIVGVAVGILVRQPRARARLRASVPVAAFGMLWFLAAAAPLTVVYPFWMPHRSIFGGLGLALALAATLGATRSALLAGLVALRLATLALSPAPPAAVTPLPPPGGAFLDFEKLVRLQRLMVETRRALQERHPALARGARVGLLRPPIMSEYAYGGGLALEAWYRDSTLRWLRYEEFSRHPEMELEAIVLYESDRKPQVMLVEPSAMRHYLQAGEDLSREDWATALADLATADSLQGDRTARMFTSNVAGRRALCRLSMGRSIEAERDAREALALWRECGDARYVLASVLAFSGRGEAARAELDTLVRLYPNDLSALALRDSLERWTARQR